MKSNTHLYQYDHEADEAEQAQSVLEFSITMILAFGTFTPTSITVVDTNTSIFPDKNPCNKSSFLSVLIYHEARHNLNHINNLM